jgi:hypothetical protein
MLRKFACLLTVAIALSCVARAQAQLPNGAANREATLNYLKELATIGERFNQKAKAARQPAQLAEVLRETATSIRRLPVRGVDPEVVECAWKTANLANRGASLLDEVAQLNDPRNVLGSLILSIILDYALDAPVFTPAFLGQQAWRAQRLEQEAREYRRELERLLDRWVEVLTRLARTYNFD